MDNFQSQKADIIPFFTDRCARNFFLPESLCISTPMTIFTWLLLVNLYIAHLKTFFY